MSTSAGEQQRTQADQKARLIARAAAKLPDGSLAEMVYDQSGRRTAFCVFDGMDWRLESSIEMDGERILPYRPANNILQHDVVLLASGPEEYESEGALIDATRGFIHRYVDVSPRFEMVATYYVLLSWVYDRFNELPYLRVRGDFGSGKTRFLQTVGSLCYKPIFASGASTVSPLFRILDAFRGTLVLDESDFRFSDEKAELTKILNNGNAQGFPVLRSELVGRQEFDPRAYAVFGPKLIASRGYFEDRALESRCITEDLGDGGLRTDIPITLPAVMRQEALHLRNQLLLYRFRHYRRSALPAALTDPKIEARFNQIFLPLLAIIDDSEARAEVRAMARQAHESLIADRALDIEAQVLEVIRDLLAAADGRPSIKDIAGMFDARFGTDYQRKVTPKWIGSIIRRRLQLVTQKSQGVFVIPPWEEPRLRRLFVKYGVEAPAPLDRKRMGDIGDVGEERAAVQNDRPWDDDHGGGIANQREVT